MGTSIKAYFPHGTEQSPEAVRERLAVALSDQQIALALIRERGRFSTHRGDWRLWVKESGSVCGEGPNGFLINVYSAVVEFTSLERFGAVALADQGVHVALRQVFQSVAAAFSADRLAVAAGGYGDTDRASDLAAAGSGFKELCESLERVVGPPARSWEALEAGAARWYLCNLG